MTQQTAQLLEQVLRLPEKERSELADKLLENLEPASEEDVEAAWGEEIRRRIEEVESGAVKPVPWDEARRQILEDIDDAVGS